jgi:uncharacterized membrane protein
MDRTFDTKRTEAFSDAIMAVAITLMVLRISPPVAGPGTSLASAFWNDTVPEIIFFLITFGVIVLFWMHHHDLFVALPERMALRAFWMNMGFLAAICLLPFGLEFFTAEADVTVLTVGVYAGLMCIATLFLAALGRSITGTWAAEPLVGAVIFLLAIPFAPLLGSWCLLVWWLDVPAERIIRARRRRAAGAAGT